MARLKRKLKASSVPECVVASVILMLSFAFSFDMLGRFLKAGQQQQEVLPAELALKQCHTEFAGGQYPDGSYECVWGEVEVEVLLEPYSPGIQKLTLSVRQMPLLKYEYLIERQNENR